MGNNITLNTRLIQRNDSKANWEKANPVLLKGEMGIETDEKGVKRFKIGDGSTAWNDLAYAIDFKDIKAEDVYFSTDLLTTTPIGNIKLSNGQATIAAKGKNLKQVFDTIFVTEVNPTTTQPSVSINCPQAKAYEVGTQVTPTFTTSFNAGKYTYDPSTNVSATTYRVTDNAGSSAVESDKGQFGALTVGDQTNYQLTVEVNHTEGSVPHTNLQNEYPAGKIEAGVKRTTSGKITGFRNIFAGSAIAPIEINSANVRSLGTKLPSAATTFNVSVVENAKCVVIAVPEGRTLSKVLDKNAFDTDIVNSFKLQEAQVEGANNYEAKKYNVYVYLPAAKLGANTYKVTIA